MLDTLARLFAPWQDLFADSAIVSTTVTAVHLTALLVAGGLALSQDRATLAGVAHPPVHRPVELGLALVVLSGLMLAAADIEVYATSLIYWIKMGLVAALLLNGMMLMRQNTVTRARISMVLWILITVVGVALTNV